METCRRLNMHEKFRACKYTYVIHSILYKNISAFVRKQLYAAKGKHACTTIMNIITLCKCHLSNVVRSKVKITYKYIISVHFRNVRFL